MLELCCGTAPRVEAASVRAATGVPCLEAILGSVWSSPARTPLSGRRVLVENHLVRQTLRFLPPKDRHKRSTDDEQHQNRVCPHRASTMDSPPLMGTIKQEVIPSRKLSTTNRYLRAL